MGNERCQPSSPAPATVGSILRQRDKLREWGGERGGDGCGDGRGPADGARRAPAQPRVEAREVEPVPALGHHPQHLALPVLAETDGARDLGVRARPGLGEGHPRVRRDDGGVEPDGGRRGGGAAGGGARRVVVLRHEHDAGHGDGDVARAGGGGGGVAGGADAGSGAEHLSGAAAAEAEVGGEQHRREEHEEAERDGDCVPETERGERVKDGHGSVAPHVVGGGGGVIVGRNGMMRGGGAEWEEGICLRGLRFPGCWRRVVGGINCRGRRRSREGEWE